MIRATLGALAIAALLAWFGPSVLDDNSAEWSASTELKAAQADAQRALRRDMAAAALCRQQHGEAGFTWTADARLVCVPRRGARTTPPGTTFAAAQEAQP